MPGQTPLVSVILPAYNAGEYVGAAIDSILTQTLADFELLIIDDGSQDDTYQVALGFNDPRLKVLRNESNRGLVVSLNRCIAEAQGELLARMDADDWSVQERLAIQVEWMQRNPRVGVLSSHYETFDDQHPVLETVALPVTDAEVRYDLYSKSHCFCHPAVLMRRQALEQAGGYKAEWFPAEDRELWMRIMETWHGANVPQVLHHMRRHGSSITSQNMRHQADRVIDATAAALTRRQSPADVDWVAQQAGWAKGELFVAFGIAAREGGEESIARHLQQAITLDQSAALGSFAELLTERIKVYMHHTAADVGGCRSFVERVFANLPMPLTRMRTLRPQMESQIHAIAASYHAQLGETSLSQRQAVRALLADRRQWRNRGLVKLSLRMG